MHTHTTNTMQSLRSPFHVSLSPFRIISIVVCLMCNANSQASAASSVSDFANLVVWMKSHGGRVDPRIDVSITKNGVRGAIALSTIENGTELLFCPWKLVIGSTGMQDLMQTGSGDSDGIGMCEVVEMMANEIRQQSDSLWYPYLDHIELPRLAAMWDSTALEELQGLSLGQDANRHIRWFNQSCKGVLDEAALTALVSFVSRASEVGMVPIYDLLNHHNGKRNAKLYIRKNGVQLLAVGNDDIQQGEEIYLSYGLKAASQIYRDYGFVEEWPTVWNFRDSSTSDNFAFVQLSHGIMAINPSADYLKSIWNSNLSQLQYETEARVHTESLSVYDLERFAQAVHNHLDESQSTLEEDRVLLSVKGSLLAEQRLISNNDGTDTSIAIAEDVISAIHYRIAFKSALTSSFLYAEAMIREDIKSQEL